MCTEHALQQHRLQPIDAFELRRMHRPVTNLPARPDILLCPGVPERSGAGSICQHCRRLVEHWPETALMQAMVAINPLYTPDSLDGKCRYLIVESNLHLAEH